MSETSELKPCMVCGSIKISIYSFNQDGKGSYEETHGPSCDECHDINSMSLNEWNNAYCWKEIEKLQAKLTIAREALENIVKHNKTIGGWMAEGSSVTKMAKKALCKIKLCLQ